MTYSIKRLRNKGDYSLSNLQSVESLDVFVSEVNKATRLWLEDLNVFMRSEDIPSPIDYIRIKCEIDPDYFSESSQFLMFYGKDISSLASTIERVLGLPDSRHDRVIELVAPTGSGTYMDLIFSPELLQSMLSAHESRSYMFVNFNITPEQSVLLAAKTNLKCLRWCSVSDDGNALLDYLEHHNGMRTLGTFSNQLDDAWEEIVTFLGRSTYAVFDELVLDQNNIHFCNSYRHELVVQANMKTMAVLINPFLFEEGECEPLVEALRDGTFVPPKLRLCFYTGHLDDDISLYETVLRDMFDAMSSIECVLKELHIELESADVSTTVQVFEEHLINMLCANKSLETLTIDSSADPLQFPAMRVLKAAAEHPCLRNVVFLPPYGSDPPPKVPSDLFQEWFQGHLSHSIHFGDSYKTRQHEGRRVETKAHVAKWQDFVFFTRFELLQRVEDERIRCHLLVAALAGHSRSPQRVHFLLSGNQDLFAK